MRFIQELFTAGSAGLWLKVRGLEGFWGLYPKSNSHRMGARHLCRVTGDFATATEYKADAPTGEWSEAA